MANASVAKARPDFSGEWKLDASQTTLEVKLRGLESAIVRIDHSDPHFHLWRRFVLEGQEHTVELGLDTTGAATESHVGDQRRVSRLTWAQESLVFTTQIEAPEGASTNIVQYSLEQAGQILQARERFRGPTLSYDNLWVFERVSGPTE